MPQTDLFSRYKRAVFIGMGIGALFYLGFSLTAEVPRVVEHLRTFRWWLLAPILLLSFSNYFIRFWRWEYYLRRLDIRIQLRTSFSIFMSGLAMTITPGKAGELLKSLLLKETTGTPIMRSAPVVVAERLTDFLALVILTGLGIGTYYQDKRAALYLVGAGLVSLVLLLNSETLSLGIIGGAARLPVVGKLAPRLEDAYRATARLLGLRALLLGVTLSTLAWFCECLGYYAVFNGHGAQASVLVSTFLYAFSTIVGVVSPGGLGVTDLSLGKGAQMLIPGMTASLAISAAFIIRLCTLWFAVLVGSIALIRFKGAVLEAVVADEEAARAELSSDP